MSLPAPCQKRQGAIESSEDETRTKKAANRMPNRRHWKFGKINKQKRLPNTYHSKCICVVLTSIPSVPRQLSTTGHLDRLIEMRANQEDEIVQLKEQERK
eukprot:GHVT01101920.1.p3 GENE.GHVT01101920.1~~GHVT01101920.1.p3  ORF type:complete len:100 (-),score=10.69 GHVT01101920.1:994-1293(-)